MDFVEVHVIDPRNSWVTFIAAAPWQLLIVHRYQTPHTWERVLSCFVRDQTIRKTWCVHFVVLVVHVTMQGCYEFMKKISGVRLGFMMIVWGLCASGYCSYSKCENIFSSVFVARTCVVIGDCCAWI